MEDYSKYWFIPKRLEIKEKPYLQVFPDVVVIMRQQADSLGNLMIVSVIYRPDFETYQDSGMVQSMRYPNVHGSQCSLLFSYHKARKSYECTKYLNEKCIGAADGGNDWSLFFAHVGMMGIAEGEPSKLEPPPPIIQNH